MPSMCGTIDWRAADHGPATVAARQSIVPHIEGMDALTVNASTGSAERLHLDVASVPPSTLSGVVTALVLLAIGIGILWGATVLLGKAGA